MVDGTEYPRRRRRGDVIGEEKTMKENLEKVIPLVRDLRNNKEFQRRLLVITTGYGS
jgi:hypothetical protein